MRTLLVASRGKFDSTMTAKIGGYKHIPCRKSKAMKAYLCQHGNIEVVELLRWSLCLDVPRLHEKRMMLHPAGSVSSKIGDV